MPLFTQAEFEARMGGTVTTARFDEIHDFIAALVVLEGGAPYATLSGDALAVVRGIAMSAAMREWDNPQRHAAESAGPFSFSGASQSIFTADELRLLGAAFGRLTGAYTVPLSTPADTAYPYVQTVP